VAWAAFLDAMFAYSDRDGDGKLSLAEPFLDAYDDGRLNYRETARFVTLVKGSARALPRQFEVAVSPPRVALWGGVAVPSVVVARAATKGRQGRRDSRA
jgi:hypothetical protein